MTAPQFIFDNIIEDVASISVTPDFSSGLPISNIAEHEAMLCARAKNKSSCVITINLNQARQTNLDGIALFGEYSRAAILRVQCYHGLNGSGDTQFDSGDMTLLEDINGLNAGQALATNCLFFYTKFKNTDDNADYLSITLSLQDDSPPQGYHQLHRAVLGEVFEPRVGTTYQSPWKITLIDSGNQTYTENSDLRTRGSWKTRRMSIPLDLQEHERLSLQQAYRKRGVQRDIFVHLQPDTTGILRQELGMNALLASSFKYDTETFNRNKINLELNEALPIVEYVFIYDTGTINSVFATGEWDDDGFWNDADLWADG